MPHPAVDSPPAYFTSIETVLYTHMQQMANGPYKQLKFDELWKLMFMERDKQMDGKNAYEEEEPGYLKGVMNGYHFMLLTLGERLTPELYEKLHDNCVEGIATAEFPNGIPKGFRKYSDGGEAFHLVWGGTVSPEGVKELSGRVRSYVYEDKETGDLYGVLKEAMFDPLQTITKEYPMIKLKPIRPETCKQNAQHCIDLYNNALKRTEDEVLHAIAALCQDLDQLHLFVDGNIRTTGILLMNKLLLENHLSPTVMKDVNQLDCLSRAEIVGLIREGQDFFRQLAMNRTI